MKRTRLAQQCADADGEVSMSTLDVLRRDHDVLRRTAAALERMLARSPSPTTACQLCGGLAHLLAQHLDREEQVLAPYLRRIQTVLHQRLCGDCAEPRVVLGDLQRLASADPTRISAQLCRLLEELREELEDEERAIFPIVECAQEGEPDQSETLKKLW